MFLCYDELCYTRVTGNCVLVRDRSLIHRIAS